ncbi:macrolide family glycosyltransferase [Amycolatopsis sp. NPDC059021]|uniref:macrolide family glycosyltransferase n=1 Tax=Amycolatopsis sp. NPDC059021 TaxID=3346704 RepID=UPI00366AEA37
MSHFAFCVPTGAGHVNPTLAVASELVARGHRVTYAAPAFFADRIAETGAELIGYESTFAKMFTEPPKLDRGELPKVMAGNLEETRAVLTQVAEGFGDVRPDLVVTDAPISWWGQLLAARWDVPRVLSWPHLVSNEHWAMTNYIEVDLHDPLILHTIEQAARLAARDGLDGADMINGTGAAANLVFLPRAFQFAGDTFTEHHFVGPALGERAFQGNWEPPASGRDVLLVSFGTAYNNEPEFYRTCLKAFAETRLHVVLVTGEQVDHASLGEVPEHVELHKSVPQLSVLRHAKAFVTHAGMGSTMESLSFGVPMVAVPQVGEQRANADRIAELGLGKHLPPADVTVHSLRDAVLSIVDNAEIAANLKTMQGEIAAAGGAPAAADVLEGLC